MKHVDGWEMDGNWWWLVDIKESNRDRWDVLCPYLYQNLLFLSVLSVLSYGRLVLTGVDLCCLVLLSCCALYHMNINWNQLKQQQTRTTIKDW